MGGTPSLPPSTPGLPDQVWDRIFDGHYKAWMSMYYYQMMEWYSNLLDMTIRALVGILAISSFTASILTFDNPIFKVSPRAAFFFSVAALALAIILNVVPVGNWYQQYSELYRNWSANRARWQNLENRFKIRQDDRMDDILLRVSELETETSYLQYSESAPWRRLLKKSQEKTNEHFYGVKRPTTEQ